MSAKQKWLIAFMWIVAGLAVLLAAAARFLARPSVQDPTLYDVPSFALTDQNGQTVTDASLRGNVWVAMVFFTQCPGICPAMMAQMRKIQQAVPHADVKIVSFSLDPEHDTPETLKAYADRLQADQSRWHLLTGPKQTMFEVARGLKLAAAPAHGDQPITHTQKVLLIGRDNRVRGIYDSGNQASMDKLAHDARELAQSQ